MSIRFKPALLGVATLSVIALLASAPAQQPSSISAPQTWQAGSAPSGNQGGPLSGDRPGPSDKRPVKMDQEQRELLLIFVREHHPELIRLLRSLEKNRPRQFEVAMKSLSHSYQRLESLQAQGKTKQYQIALDQWKLSSRVKLSAAQVAVKDTPQNRQKLETLISQQYDSRMGALKAEQARLRERLERLSDQLEKQSDRQLEIERAMDTAMRTASRTLQRAKTDRGEKRADSAEKKPARSAGDQKAKSSNPNSKREPGRKNDDGSNRK